MLAITKPTVFGPSGMAVRGQCGHDSPDWHLEWLDPGAAGATLVWKGDYKTCRHLQSGCRKAATLAEARTMADSLLSDPAPHDKTHVMDRDSDTDFFSADAPPGQARPADGQNRRKKKKKRHV